MAAAIAVPLLVLLYVLKLRRRPQRIASTLLWRRATRDLAANVPFQRLRPSWLLVLQLAVVAAVAAALGRPVVQAPGEPPRRLILLVDRSASMSATDAGGRSRLESAKEAARQIVSRLARSREPGAVMLVAFARTPEVIIGFEHNRRLLLDAIDSIGPTDEEANLEAALDLAGAFASRDESTTRPQVVLISDGGVRPPGDARGFVLAAGELRFVGVGPAADDPVDNLGIADFSGRRAYEDPARVLLFARLVNAGSRPLQAILTLRVDGRSESIRTVTVPAADERGPGEAPASFSLELPGEALLTLSIGRRDSLPGDDSAALVVRPPPAPRLALIHPPDGPDPLLAELASALEAQRVVLRPSAQTAGGPPPVSAGEFDLIIFDRVSPAALPQEPAIFLGAAPPTVRLDPPPDPGGRRILSWDRQHPLMRHVSLDAVTFSGFGALVLSQDATALAFGPGGPAIAVVEGRSARHVVVGFEPRRSSWPVDVSFAVFMQNALDYLTLGAASRAQSFSPGDPITVRCSPEASRLRIQGPVAAELDARPGAEETLPALRLAGLYTITGAEPPMDRIAVNAGSVVESDIRSRTILRVNAQEQRAAGATAAAALELWPILAGMAVVLLTVEWVVYCLRMRG
jgi:hypothetical protein